MTKLTLGSLFEGIGVFPLAASRYGFNQYGQVKLKKLPYLLRNDIFLNIHHLGDITKVNGGEIPPVHIIPFGSPCRNLSNIGKQEGLTGSQARVLSCKHLYFSNCKNKC
ncbi:MAG TPA: DNA cytosine methyltransferase [Pseudogracilibacillus sp.]|nr:DNA cytosine methyltransferase [Pseudogracilibacillus sp.]